MPKNRPLSPAERQVLHLAAQGLDGRWIAAMRHGSPSTVSVLLARARVKLRARDTANAIALAMRQGQL